MLRWAVVIPAYNEEKTIKEVIRRFHRKMPAASLYIIDNNSSDETNRLARAALKEFHCKGGVISETRRGKGNAVRRAFLTIEADIYVLVDADLTYSENDLARLADPVVHGDIDMCVGDRHAAGTYARINKRKMHNFGNNLVKFIVNTLFHARLKDIMSGYRVFNRFFVKNIPILSEGFEIETEMTLHAIDKKFRIKEMPIEYSNRPPGSSSKLRTVTDGLRVTRTIFNIFRYYKPLAFFNIIALVLFVLGILIGIPVVYEFIITNFVSKVPSAVLAAAVMILSALMFIVGLILDTVVRNNRYTYELSLLRHQSEGRSRAGSGNAGASPGSGGKRARRS